jgi:hypothetical protein
MMCEKKREVKRGLQPKAENAGARENHQNTRSKHPPGFHTIGMTCRRRAKWKTELGLVAGELDAAGLHGFRQSAADEAQSRGWGIPLWLE